jgi:hypothetical protein
VGLVLLGREFQASGHELADVSPKVGTSRQVGDRLAKKSCKGTGRLGLDFTNGAMVLNPPGIPLEVTQLLLDAGPPRLWYVDEDASELVRYHDSRCPRLNRMAPRAWQREQ